MTKEIPGDKRIQQYVNPGELTGNFKDCDHESI